jgi:broad specificity phosphatase PhoE
VSQLYLIRHGQAGPRHRYDTLSELGQAQCRRLGEHLAASRMEFTAAYVGTLARQRLTAEIVRDVYIEAGLPFPELTEDPLWDEFDLGAVYEALAGPLGEDDPRFRIEFEQMMAAISNGDHEVHRNHNYCDIAIVRAWTEDRYAYKGESWRDFRSRTTTPIGKLSDFRSGERIAVFTSATPIGVWMGEALQLSEREIWRLAGATYNSGVTTLRIATEELRLFTFNGIAHLPDPSHWTFR